MKGVDDNLEYSPYAVEIISINMIDTAWTGHTCRMTWWARDNVILTFSFVNN